MVCRSFARFVCVGLFGLFTTACQDSENPLLDDRSTDRHDTQFLNLDDEDPPVDFRDLRIVAKNRGNGGNLVWDFSISPEGESGEDYPYQFLWDFGPQFGGPREGAAQSITFPVTGEYLITVTVLNESGKQLFVLTLNLNVSDEAPVANAGEDVTVVAGGRVCLDGAASTVFEGAVASYTWEQTGGTAVELPDGAASAARLCFDAPLINRYEDLHFLLTVSDGFGTAADDVVVHVQPGLGGAGSVVADAGPNQLVTGGQVVQLDGSASIGDNESTLEYEWEQTSGPAVTLSEANSAVTTFVAPLVEQPTALAFNLTVSAGSFVSIDEVVITVLVGAAGDDVEIDNCPDDDAKLDPGVCGCGVPDADLNLDGQPDCLDPVEDGFPLEDYAAYACGANPQDWLDTGAGNSMNPADDFRVICVGASRMFGTTSGSTNIHSHYVGTGSAAWRTYIYTGRMLMTNANGGMGVTFLSNYPNSDAYYRLRRGPFSGGYAFHLDAHPDATGSFTGTTQTTLTPVANSWYRFHVEVVDTDTRTEVRANIWAEGSPEPAGWMIEGYDSSAGRRRSGTVGVWSMGTGAKYWDDLEVYVAGCDADSDDDGTADCADRCPDDPNKTNPGACGCGVEDADADLDGLTDCHDDCTTGGDSDGDGVIDCADGCPADGTKTAPGACGCGVADTDSDGDGLPDCVDRCPGAPDTDSDGDGVPNCVDACPGFNDAQDADNDGVPDGCDDPRLALSSTSVSFAGLTTQVTIEVWNAGGGQLSYSLADNAAWLSVSPISGASTGERDAITLVANRNGLAYGTHSAVLTVTPSIGAPQTVNVTLSVQPPGDVLTPIARWDVVPRQRINAGETFKTGVVAFSKAGIREVQFHISGQGYSGTNPKIARTMTLNDRVNVWEYWVPISAGEFASDGPITVEAVVVGNDGGIRDKNTSGKGLEALTLYVNPNGTLPANVAYVSTTGNDSTGAVNDPSRPFKSVTTAMQRVAAIQGGKADGAKIRLRPGDHTILGPWVSGEVAPTVGEWITITNDPAAGGTQANTRIVARENVVLTSNWLRVDGLTLAVAGLFDGGSTWSLWLSNCDIRGGSGDFPFPVGWGWNGPQYYTELVIRDQRRVAGDAGVGRKIARNLTMINTREDNFQAWPFGVNITVQKSDPGSSGAHADVIQGPNATCTECARMENWIWYNVVATDLHYQGIFVRSGGWSRNNAFVNCLMETRAPIRVDVAPPDNSTFVGKYDHLLMWNCSFLGTQTEGTCVVGGYEATTSPANGFAMKNVSIRGCLFAWFKSYVSAADKAWVSNPDVEFYDNHYGRYDPAYHGMIPDSGGGTISQGSPGLDTNTSSVNFARPLSNSPLVGRISPPLVPADATGRPHGATADVGALRH